jgi:hypothetical protein
MSARNPKQIVRETVIKKVKKNTAFGTGAGFLLPKSKNTFI